ncbi:hypothetical protein TNCV_1220781 [Trichonephila clavipes]|nr:hypothetical protein TNCV_1220781 [Trichonephila clavipes]
MGGMKDTLKGTEIGTPRNGRLSQQTITLSKIKKQYSKNNPANSGRKRITTDLALKDKKERMERAKSVWAGIGKGNRKEIRIRYMCEDRTHTRI